jgi:competence protein ComEA
VSSLPPFLEPPDDWRGRLRGMLLGTGRQRLPLAVLALVTLGVGVFVWAQLRPQPQPAPADGGPITAAQVQATATPQSRAGGGSGAGVTVHVTGRVRQPGVQELPAGSRVADAVAAAGGTTAGADLERVNLARKLLDGEQVQVPTKGQPLAAPPAPGAPASPGEAGPTQGQPLDLNTATAEQLEALPGVGEVTAQRIVAHRAKQPFRSVEDLLDVEGIGERRLESLRGLVAVAG